MSWARLVEVVSNMTDWRSEYEAAADKEAARFAGVSDRDLMDAFRCGTTGDYYAAWREVATRHPSAEACWLLYDVLRSERPYLDRYHCAAALLELLRCREFEPVQLSAAWPEVPQNLDRLCRIVETTVGPRP